MAGLACFTLLCPWQTSPVSCCPLPPLSSSPDLGFLPGRALGRRHQSISGACVLKPACLPGLNKLRGPFSPSLYGSEDQGTRARDFWGIFSEDMGCSSAMKTVEV